MPRGGRGFTLVELLLVVAIIGIIASITVPMLQRSRAAALEVSTIASLRTLVSAQATFAATCAGGTFAPTIAALSSGTGRTPFVGPEFRANTIDRFGYRIRFTAGPVAVNAPKTCNGLLPGRTRQSYFIGADPISAGAGQGSRHFATGAGATIYESTIRIPAFYTGAPPPPARPVR